MVLVNIGDLTVFLRKLSNAHHKFNASGLGDDKGKDTEKLIASLTSISKHHIITLVDFHVDTHRFFHSDDLTVKMTLLTESRPTGRKGYLVQVSGGLDSEQFFKVFK